jgi:hypothetical protein
MYIRHRSIGVGQARVMKAGRKHEMASKQGRLQASNADADATVVPGGDGVKLKQREGTGDVRASYGERRDTQDARLGGGAETKSGERYDRSRWAEATKRRRRLTASGV